MATITVVLVNDPPAIDLDVSGGGTGYAADFTEEAGAVNATDSVDATVTDDDDTTLPTWTIVAAGVVDGASEILTFDTEAYPLNVDKTATEAAGGTTFNIAYTTGTQTFAITNDGGGDMPIGDLNTLLRKITYNNTLDEPTAGARTFSHTVNDGDADSNTAVWGP